MMMGERHSTKSKLTETKMNFRNIIINVTTNLVGSGQILLEEDRNKYLELYSKTPETRETMKISIPFAPCEDGSGGLILSSMEALDTANPNNDLPVAEWMKLVLAHKPPCIKQTKLRVGAQSDIRHHNIIVALKGSVLQKMDGYKMYQCYGKDYAGTLIFNLGKDFDYKWFCTREHVHTLQAQIIQHGLPSNCDVFILNFKSKPVPVIYATRDIKEDETLCLSKDTLSKLNESFISWYADTSVRRSNRVPSQSKSFENMYELHILSKKQDGLERRFHNGEYGVFTTRIFLEGEYLVEFSGELIDENTALGRFHLIPEKAVPYMFFLGKKFNKYCIDATQAQSSLARFVGHSIQKSNCKTMCKWIDKKPRVFLVAKTTISENSQLFYDYNVGNGNFTGLNE